MEFHRFFFVKLNGEFNVFVSPIFVVEKSKDIVHIQ